MIELSESDADYLISHHPEITPEMIANPQIYVQPGQAMAIHVTDDFSGAVRDYIITRDRRVFDITATDPQTGSRINPDIAQKSTLEIWWDSIGGGLKDSLDPFKAGSITNMLLVAGGIYLLWQAGRKK